MNLASRHRPPLVLSLPFFVLGFASLALALALMLRVPELLTGPTAYRPQVIALAHVLNLGFVCSLIFGAAYQIAPVIAEDRLWSPRLAYLHLLLHGGCLPGFVLGLVRGDYVGAGHWGSGLAFGLMLFIVNLGITLQRRSPAHPAAWGLYLSLFWLWLTAGLALLMMAARFLPISVLPPFELLGLHARTAYLGFFVQAFLAVSFQLVPMFALSRHGTNTGATACLVLLNAGLLLLVPAALLHSPGMHRVAVIGLALGVLCGMGQLLRDLACRNRALEDGMRLYLACLPGLLGGALLWFAAEWDAITAAQTLGVAEPRRLWTAAGAAFLLAGLAPAILGIGGKIVPFLVWQSRYASEIGRRPVPRLNDLFHPALPRLQLPLVWFGPSLLVLGILYAQGLAVRVGASFLAAALVLQVVALVQVLSHLRRPKPTAAAAGPTATAQP